MVKFYNYVDVSRNFFQLDGERVIIWGRSESALNLYFELQSNNKADIVGFTDSFVKKSGEDFAGLPVLTHEEIMKMGRVVIYIATRTVKYQREILNYVQSLKNAIVLCRGLVFGPGQYDVFEMSKKIKTDIQKIQLVKKEFSDEKSISTFEKLLNYRISNDKSLLEEVCESGHMQYFPDESILKKQNEEVFIDAGGYFGETSYGFSEWTDGKYRKIYIMEPDKVMFSIMKEYVKLKKMYNVKLVNKAAYSGTKEINFISSIATGSSKVAENGNGIVQTISIDQMLKGEKATFIKMDIEGAEMDALEGAKDTIINFRPKLAISVYHKDDDLWNIPCYIMKHYPWYRLFLRHYTPLTTETVLYATV